MDWTICSEAMAMYCKLTSIIHATVAGANSATHQYVFTTLTVHFHMRIASVRSSIIPAQCDATVCFVHCFWLNRVSTLPYVVWQDAARNWQCNQQCTLLQQNRTCYLVHGSAGYVDALRVANTSHFPRNGNFSNHTVSCFILHTRQCRKAGRVYGNRYNTNNCCCTTQTIVKQSQQMSVKMAIECC